MDLKIDRNHDMVIENGDLVLIKDGPAIGQHIKMRLATWLGETPYNTSAGVPYRTIIFQPNTSREAIIFILTQAVLQTPGVITCELDYVANTTARTMTVTGRATSINGPIDFTLDINEGNP